MLKPKTEKDRQLIHEISERILNGMKTERTSGYPLPKTIVAFALFISRWLDHVQLGELDRLETAYGEEACNEWFVSVLVKTGLYGSDVKGFVELLKEAT